MAVSCPEVMYGAYYPYLYGRGAATTRFHHAPHFQYDRLNVPSATGNEPYGGGAAVSSGSASSGAQSPGSPHHHHRLRAKEEDHSRASNDGGASSDSEGECGGAGAAGGAGSAGARARAQYVSANCVVFTHYSGDVAAVVDDHFSRALAMDKHKESVPMVSRNLPASFFNAALGPGPGPGAGGPGAGPGPVDLYEYDPWHQHYGGYGPAAQYHAAAAATAQAHHSMAAAGYPGLLLPRSHLHHQYKPVEWGHHAHAHHAHHAHAQHAAHLDPAACSPYSYPTVPGLEPQMQDTSKDLYWF